MADLWSEDPRPEDELSEIEARFQQASLALNFSAVPGKGWRATVSPGSRHIEGESPLEAARAAERAFLPPK
jgi:hypothetical protein